MLIYSLRINYGISQTLAPSHSQWLIPFAVQLIPGGLLLFGTIWLRESPRWLIGNGQREKGLKNLCWIRQLPADDIYIIEEVASIDAAIEEQRHALGEGFWKPFIAVGKNRKVQWRFFLGGALFLWQNGSGINAINYYSPTVFASLGITGTSQGFLTTGIFGKRFQQFLCGGFNTNKIIRRRQDCSYCHLASVPHRQTWAQKASHGWCNRR
jgi:Sugar (and other) transporter